MRALPAAAAWGDSDRDGPSPASPSPGPVMVAAFCQHQCHGPKGKCARAGPGPTRTAGTFRLMPVLLSSPDQRAHAGGFRSRNRGASRPLRWCAAASISAGPPVALSPGHHDGRNAPVRMDPLGPPGPPSHLAECHTLASWRALAAYDASERAHWQADHQSTTGTVGH
jgi:hypothetical protein